MRRTAWWLPAMALVAALVAPSGGATTTYTHGYDISWPQCSGSGDGSRAGSLPGSSAHFAVLGLTHGAGHTANPCLGAQVSWARAHNVPVGAYLVASYPTNADLAAESTGMFGACGSDAACRRRHDGAAQAVDALEVMRRAGVPAPMVWVDVEFRHVHPWSKSHAANVDVLRGLFAALSQAGMPYGVYTTSYMWEHIAGSWRSGAAQWLPSGDGDPSHAKAKCAATGSGGTTWLVQYTRRFDEDLTCPILDATPGHPGPLWPYRYTSLSLGSTGAAVTALQRAVGTLAVTGRYDAQTAGSVTTFQVQHGLPVTGAVDTDDWRALGAFRLIGGHPFWLSRIVAPVA